MHSDLRQQNQLQQQKLHALLDKGRFIWGFPKALELDYSQHLRKKVLQRIPMVGFTSIVFFLLFAIFDQYMLPANISSVTASARVFIVCPVILIGCLWIYFKPPKYYLIPYGFTFLFGSLSVVWVIWLAHSHSVLLPYEGLMITMMYGFVVMGFPLLIACLLNAITLYVYVVTEPFYYLSFHTYVNNVIFLVAMYLAGSVSAVILSYSQRSQFLQQALLNLSEERARLDLEAKNRYLAVASHDLRQPLQAINMMTDQMCEQTNDEHLHKLQSAAHALSNMFDQLLDSSKINLDLMEIEHAPVDLTHIVKHSMASSSVAYEANHIELHWLDEQGKKITSDNEPDAQYVWGDYAAIQRIINNLLQNALVHSGASMVTLNTCVHDEFIDLIIKDNGRGILETDKAHAFEEFNQLNTQNKDQGLGVGLSIVDKLSKAMGFKLALNSINGCEFIITMPVCHKPPLDSSVSSTGLRILVVEDDASLAMQYDSWFKNWHWNCEVVNTVKGAEVYLDEKPQWVITDWNLPDGSGEDVLNCIETLKQQDSDYTPNIMVISSNTNLENRLPETCQYLEKPITAPRLRALLEGLGK